MGKGLSPLTIYRRNTMDCQDSQQRNTSCLLMSIPLHPSGEQGEIIVFTDFDVPFSLQGDQM